jgi:preprotein translocase subunit SecE
MISISKARQFFTEARQELRKVTWPNKQQTMSSTWVVIIVTIILASFLGVVDLILSKAVGLILK